MYKFIMTHKNLGPLLPALKEVSDWSLVSYNINIRYLKIKFKSSQIRKK